MQGDSNKQKDVNNADCDSTELIGREKLTPCSAETTALPSDEVQTNWEKEASGERRAFAEMFYLTASVYFARVLAGNADECAGVVTSLMQELKLVKSYSDSDLVRLGLRVLDEAERRIQLKTGAL